MGKKKNGHNWIEKFTFSLGVLVLIALFTYLILQITSKKNAPAQLVITTTVQPQMDHYSYKVIIENLGEETAEAVNLTMDLYQNGETVVSGTMTINYVPVKSTEIGYIIFHREKKPKDSLVVSSVTYLKP